MTFFARVRRVRTPQNLSQWFNIIHHYICELLPKKKKTNSKGLFFNLPGSFPSGLEQRERTAWISSSKTHYLLLLAHLSDSISNEISSPRRPHQKRTLRVSVTNVGSSERLKTRTNRTRRKTKTKQNKKNKKTKTGATKEHLPPPAHVVGPNSGSPNKTLSSAARQYAKTLSPVLSQVSCDERERKEKASCCWFRGANTFSLVAVK